MQVYKVLLLTTLGSLCLGEPMVKSVLVAIGAVEPLATVAYDIASVGASVVVQNQNLLQPFLYYFPDVQLELGAAGLLGGKVAGGTVGGLAGNQVRGLIYGESGNDTPLVGWIIREDGKKP